MNSRERFALVMSHTTPDRTPIDIGGTSLTGMRPQCQENLRQLLGFSRVPEALHHGIDEKILEWAGTDFRSVGAIVDLPGPHTRRISDQAYIDCWGIRRDFNHGEWQITHSPLAGASLDDLKSYPWPAGRVDEKQLVATVLTGTANPIHLDENVAAVESTLLSRSDERRLQELFGEIAEYA